jgi:hypothetical protein
LFEPVLIGLVEVLDKPHSWATTQRFVYTRGLAPDSKVRPITIAHPFETDLASIPLIFTWMFPKYGRHTKAVILHDYLCQFQKDRFWANCLFLDAMTESDVPAFRKWLMWGAVT